MIINEMSKPKISEPIHNAAILFFKNQRTRKVSADVELDEQMNRLGWKEVGSGMYGIVYANENKSYVLKITKDYDSGYEHYVNVIHRFPNKHFPKISDMKKLRIGKRNYYIYLIEKLITIPTITGDKIAEYFDTAIDAYFGVSRSQMDRELNLYFHNRVPKVIANDPSMREALYIVANKQGKVFSDMHGGNIMKRKDGTIVITDPYS
jgi:hypothetical protein